MTIKEILKKTIPDSNMFEKYWEGNSQNKNTVCLKKIVSVDYDNIEVEKLNILVFADFFNDYLTKFPTPPAYKQHVIREFFMDWLTNIAESTGQMVDVESVIKNYKVKDKTIDLLNILQSREPISKEDLSEKLGVSRKTIQTDLRLLSPSLKRSRGESYKNKNLTIAGYSINAEVKEIICDNNIKCYYMPNTIHPLILLSNVTQIGILLKALANLDDSEIAELIGADIWLQISDYCKNKVREHFAQQDSNLLEMIDRIEEAKRNHKVLRYVTERDLEKATISEMITMAVKADRICDVYLKINDTSLELKKQKIELIEMQKNNILKNKYVAKSIVNPDETLEFILENVEDIEFS